MASKGNWPDREFANIGVCGWTEESFARGLVHYQYTCV